MKVLLTGPFGNVGLSTLRELVNRKYEVKILDIKSSKNEKLSKEFKDNVEIIWGDLRNFDDVDRAVKDVNVVLHVGAIIPPLADREVEFAEEVNVGGTKNIIEAMEKSPLNPKLVFTSSIATYGDRRNTPEIKVDDPLSPTDHDEYGKQKVRCEKLARDSKLDWCIFRLTYIVSTNKLQMDPLMFSMPLETCIEICDTKDTGLALVNAVESREIIGETLNIAGGPKCRITYKEYINKMLDLFGLGRELLPDEAFSTNDFHCGFMDTTKSQELLNFQRYTLEDYFREVKDKVKYMRWFLRSLTLLVRPIAKKYLLSRSPYYKVVS